MVEEPRSAAHNRVWVVTDYKALERRLFFTAEQSEEGFFEWPGDG